MNSFWRRLVGFSPIKVYGEQYMDRFRIVNLPDWLGGYGIRIHHIYRSDSGRDLHDHPFDFISIIIAGPGYTEYTKAGARFYPQFSIIRRRAEDLHRLELTAPVWTVVLRGPRRKRWGFATEDGWVDAEEWIARENEKIGFKGFTYVRSDD